MILHANCAVINAFLVLLMLGVGVNQMYLIIGAIDRVDKVGYAKLEDHFGEALSQVGMNMCLSTGTSALAFLSSIGSKVPAISGFCLYASFCLLFIFIAFATLFVPLAVLDQRRIHSRRSSCMPCIVFKERKVESPPPPPTSDMTGDAKPRPKTSKSIVEWYCYIVTHPVIRVIIILAFLIATGFASAYMMCISS